MCLYSRVWIHTFETLDDSRDNVWRRKGEHHVDRCMGKAEHHGTRQDYIQLETRTDGLPKHWLRPGQSSNRCPPHQPSFEASTSYNTLLVIGITCSNKTTPVSILPGWQQTSFNHTTSRHWHVLPKIEFEHPRAPVGRNPKKAGTHSPKADNRGSVHWAAAIPVIFIKCLVHSMYIRYLAVINANGGHMRYLINLIGSRTLRHHVTPYDIKHVSGNHVFIIRKEQSLN